MCKMKEVINILINNKEIRNIRREFDPFHKKFNSHISLVYPFENIPQKKLYSHIKKSIENFSPFYITLKNPYASVTKDSYICLPVLKNKNILMKLYKKLNSGILKGFENIEVKYKPHITLGVFKGACTNDFTQAYKKIKDKKINIEIKINCIYLLTLKKDFSIRNIKRFYFKK